LNVNVGCHSPNKSQRKIAKNRILAHSGADGEDREKGKEMGAILSYIRVYQPQNGWYI
jgi:hypothetical protein